MNHAIEQTGTVSDRLPFLLVAGVACLAVGAWIGLHRLKPLTRGPWLAGLNFCSRALVGTVALAWCFQALRHGLVLAAPWGGWGPAAMGAIAVECVVSLYQAERRLVPARQGRLLLSIRIALVLLLPFMLMKPVWAHQRLRRLRQYVAVLVDDSASMHVADSSLSPVEKARAGDLFAPAVRARVCRLDGFVSRLRRARMELVRLSDPAAAGPAGEGELRSGPAMDTGGRDRAVADLGRSVGEAEKAMASASTQSEFAPDLRLRLRTLAEGLRDRVREPLSRLSPGLATNPGPAAAAAAESGAVISALAEAESALAAASEQVDAGFYASLSDVERQRLDAFLAQDRAWLVRVVLDGVSGPGPGGDRRTSLLRRLNDEYHVRLYRFAVQAQEMAGGPEVRPVELPTGDRRPGAAAANSLVDDQQLTDLGAAIEKAGSDIPPGRLAGLILLTDGRHNGPGNPETAAARLGRQGVPVCAVVFGAASCPTRDLAIASVQAPETVLLGDKIVVDAELKVDGAADVPIRVALFRDDKAVEVRDVRTEGERYRTRLQLSDEPTEAGLHHYRVRVDPVENEVLATNNEQAVSVAVTEDRTRLLLIEDRPRWEFRYLKNLFVSRDRTVRLQYVLLHPDTLPGMPARPSVAASVARPFADVEATALPASEDEWLKFDVIVLGDVDLEAMPAEVARVLERFVGVRGGTLVVVAGRTAMPHALAGTPFADVLPVTVRAPPPGLDLLPAPEAGFRVKLTPDGRDHVLARLDPSPPRNEEVWDGLPSMRWRHGLVTAKDGATVLAFALPLEQGSAIATSRPHEVPDEATILARARFAREHPLLVIHEVGPGRVLFLGTDETWRLRYRVGDALHHRFWGQVLRWATADKLPGGTAHVRLGTERTRYPLTADVRVRARLTRADFSPVVSDQISVNVFAADTLVLKRRLEPDGRVPGLYAANLGRFVPGTYRVDLDAPPVRSALAEAGVESVSAGFAVEATVPAEQVELAADRGLLDRLAGLSRGMVVEPQNAVELTSALGPGLVSRPETRQWALWDSWVLWFAFGGLAGTEWWLRKRVRLP